MNKKTERKNKTNQTIKWPSNDEYFTIESLFASNQHMKTPSGNGDITLRVKLADAITNKKMVASIGTLNSGKGRPKLAFAMTPVTQVSLNKAKANGIMLIDDTKLVTVMEIKPVTKIIPVEVTPVKTHAVSV